MANDVFYNDDNRPPPTMADLRNASEKVKQTIKARWAQLAAESMERWLTMEEMREITMIVNGRNGTV